MVNTKENSKTLEQTKSNQALKISLNTPVKDDRPVYICGSFNAWKERDEVFKMKDLGNGKYEFNFPAAATIALPFEFKFLKGGWKDVELDQYGNFMPNHKISSFQDTSTFEVPYWMKSNKTFDPDYYPRIQLVSEKFEIPQLKKTRRVRILLPSNYKSTNKRYPVIYLQDAQNLFNEYSPFGNWAIDKSLAVLAEHGKGDVIVVAIDHGDKDRIKEFTLTTGKHGKAEGKQYLRFMADTLKPYIDQHYRTLPDREFNALGGSSMGALISIYGSVMYPEVFSKSMILSPSLWQAQKINFRNFNYLDPQSSKIYLYAGAHESTSMIPYIKSFRHAIESNNTDEHRTEFFMDINPIGTHSEANWAKVFPKAIDWLFFSNGE